MKRILRLDVCDYNENSVCNIFDSQSNVSGQATDVFITYERNGWKELTFEMPSVIEGSDGTEDNYRLDYLVADYLIRASIDDDEVDWFLISEPKVTHNSFSKNVSVTAGHISQTLKTKNLALEFSDEEGNNVGTPSEFLDTILEGTGWHKGEVKQFYENYLDEEGNKIVKVRTMNASAKTGAFKLIADMCDLFDAKPVYHGSGTYIENGQTYTGRTVDILPMNPFSEDVTEGMVPEEVNASNGVELHYSKNIKSITRTINTENLITKLYAYGAYGDLTGMCSIQTCEHKELTFTLSKAYNAGTEFTFTDDGITYFFLSERPLSKGNKLVWSKLDLLSRSYVWDGEIPCPTYKQKAKTTSVSLTGETTFVKNYVPALMNFEYYQKIGLLNSEQFKELAQYQRDIPALYQASEEAVRQKNEKDEELSMTAESNTGFLKLAIASVNNDNGKVNLKIKTSSGDNGVLYRTDYDEAKKNYFSWYVTEQLDGYGEPVVTPASILYIIHNTNPVTWDTAYLYQINGESEHYHYGMNKPEPEEITVHLNFDDYKKSSSDRYYLFCTNSMSGRLGVCMSEYESIQMTLQNELKDETVKHPVFFTDKAATHASNVSRISEIQEDEYGWLYLYYKPTSEGYKEGVLYFCNRGNGEIAWSRVYTGDEDPTITNPGYYFNLRTKTLWCRIKSKWTQMTTVKNERLARNTSVVLKECRERDRLYRGWYEKYTNKLTAALPIGNYAFKNEYDVFWLFSTDRAIAKNNTIWIDSNHMWLYQDNDPEHIVSVVSRPYDIISDFPSSNILKNVIYSSGSISTTGIDVSNNNYIRTSYIRVFENTKYNYSFASGVTGYVYYYDQNKKFLSRASMKASGSFTTSKSSGIPDASATTEYKGATYYIRIALKTTTVPNSSHYIQMNDYQNRLVVNDKLYKIITGFTGSGEYIGLNYLMKQFAELADEVYGTLIPNMQDAQNAIRQRDLQLVNSLKDMLKEGYWQENNYTEGDEERLYRDALDNLKEISKPEITYDIDFLDLYGSDDLVEDSLINKVSWPDLQVTDAVHLIDEDLDISCWGYIDKLSKCYDQPWKTTIEINTKLSLIDQHDFTDVMAHIAEVAKETKAKQTLYARSAALTGSGQLAAERLKGTLKTYVTSITGGASNWSTDEDGNMIFTSSDDRCAMMLSGNGLAIAKSKDKYGNWEWTTAATGDGVVADAITTGTLSATLIEAGSITTDKLSASVGQDLEISSNAALALFATTDGSRPAGSLETQVVGTDGSYTKPGSKDSYIVIAAKEGSNDAHIDVMTGGLLNLYGSQLNAESGSSMTFKAKSTFTVKSGGAIDFQSGSTFTISSTNFNIDKSGNVSMTGTVTANAGEIAGFIIESIKNKDNTYTRYLYSKDGPSTPDESAAGVHISTLGIRVGTTSKYFLAKADGTAEFTGKITANSGTLGGITISSSGIYTGSKSTSDSTEKGFFITKGGNFYVGPYDTDAKTRPFTLTSAGVLTARQATITGKITATSGKIASWTIGSNFIGSNATKANAQTGMAYVSGNANVAFWAGHTKEKEDMYADSAFAVKNDGTVKATKGTIATWTIGTDYIGSNGTKKNAQTGMAYVEGNDEKDLPNVAFWAGHTSKKTDMFVDSAFAVRNDGTIKATKGTIAGWQISGSTLKASSGAVGLESNKANDNTTAIWAGGALSATTPFRVTFGGKVYASNLIASGGSIGGWEISSSILRSGERDNKSGIKSETYVSLDGSTDKHPISGGTDLKYYAFWCGNTNPENAPFSVTKDGIVTIKKLRVQKTKNEYVEVDLNNWLGTESDGEGDQHIDFDTNTAMGKLKFQTIKSINQNKTTGEITIYYTNDNGGTSSSTFNSAASVQLEGHWGGTTGKYKGRYYAEAFIYLDKDKNQKKVLHDVQTPVFQVAYLPIPGDASYFEISPGYTEPGQSPVGILGANKDTVCLTFNANSDNFSRSTVVQLQKKGTSGAITNTKTLSLAAYWDAAQRAARDNDPKATMTQLYLSGNPSAYQGQLYRKNGTSYEAVGSTNSYWYYSTSSITTTYAGRTITVRY